MELFYLNEHTSCYNYSKSMQEGFRYYKFDEGLNHEEELVKDCILFVLKGSLQFSCNGFQFTVSSGEMVFFCRDSLFNTQSLEKCEVVAALFEGGVWPCQRASFSELYHLREIVEYRMEPLEIRDRLCKFLELLVCYLEDGANCIHFHEIKLKELFWNIRFYYSRQELANFFYMIIGRSQDFKNKVLNNYKSCRTVKELASACDISLSAFKSFPRSLERLQPNGCRNSCWEKSNTNFQLQTCRWEPLPMNWSFPLLPTSPDFAKDVWDVLPES